MIFPYKNWAFFLSANWRYEYSREVWLPEEKRGLEGEFKIFGHPLPNLKVSFKPCSDLRMWPKCAKRSSKVF